MSWQSKVLGLVKNHGASAKFAVSTILNVCPGIPGIVVALVEKAFDSVQKTAQDNWETDLSKQIQTTVENQARLEQLLDILGGDLQHLVAQVAKLETTPEIAQKLVETSQLNDARLQEAVKRLDVIAHRFDHLEELTTQVLASQQTAHSKLDELLTRRAENPLPGYFDAINKLLTQENFRASERHDQSRIHASVLTRTVLRDLDPSSKRDVVVFLLKNRLIEYPNTLISLQDADLSGADLHEIKSTQKTENGSDGVIVNFCKANLQGANLTKANLKRARLYKADLSKADLTGAHLQSDLRKAVLIKTVFQETKLSNADLSQAELRDAVFRGAELTNTDFNKADCTGADLHDADLRRVLNLTQEQLEVAKGDETVKLPRNLVVPVAWRSKSGEPKPSGPQTETP